LISLQTPLMRTWRPWKLPSHYGCIDEQSKIKWSTVCSLINVSRKRKSLHQVLS
jgi:hypothetical protein